MKRSFMMVFVLGLSVSSAARAQDASGANGGKSSGDQGRASASSARRYAVISPRGSSSNVASSNPSASKPVVVEGAHSEHPIIARLSSQPIPSTSNDRSDTSSNGSRADSPTSMDFHPRSRVIYTYYGTPIRTEPSYGKDPASETSAHHRPRGYVRRDMDAGQCERSNTKERSDNVQALLVKTTFEPSDSEDYKSQDGTRTVKIDRTTRDAYLYDTSDTPEFQPVFLGSEVESAEFSRTDAGNGQQIVLKLQDGSSEVFDGLGQSYVMTKAANFEPIDDMSQR